MGGANTLLASRIGDKRAPSLGDIEASLAELESNSLALKLLRPFIDLEPCKRGPLCSLGVEQYWLAFADQLQPRFVLQRTLPTPFRSQLLSEAGLNQYQADDPRDVPAELRSSRWSAVCDKLDHWDDLARDDQCRLMLILHGLCFYRTISETIPSISNKEIASNPDSAELAYRRASARYMLDGPDRVDDYGFADLSELERIINTVPSEHPAAFNGALKILVHKARAGAPIDELLQWYTRSKAKLETDLRSRDKFTQNLMLSRFFRAGAFVPQRKGDRAEVVHMMDLAERYAVDLRPDTEAQKLLKLENLYPVIESRVKEALWLGDLDLALTRAQRLKDLDPFDSRAWLQLGQVLLERNEWMASAEAYAAAAILGPPSSAVGRHMAGVCFRHLGQPLLAAFFFKAAIDVDPKAISPHDEIQRLLDLPVVALLKEWSLQSF